MALAPTSAARISERFTSLASMGSAERQRSRERIHRQVVHPITTPRLLRDPLVRREPGVSAALRGLRLMSAALGVHVGVVLLFAFGARVIGPAATKPPAERLRVSIVHPVAEHPPPPVEEPEPMKPPVVAQPKPLPRPPPPKPKVRSPKPAPALRAEMAPEPVHELPSDRPRQVVGLSFESIVEGSGPAFVVGTDLHGHTSSKPSGSAAVVPGPVQSASARTLEPPRQRAASRIPTRDALFTKPQRTSPQKPAYPSALRARNIEGDVTVKVDLDSGGAVLRATLVSSSGHEEFDRTALATARQERFRPASRDGQPVPFTLTYTYRFRISD
jgi:periplasmic protein TonB